MSRKVNLENFTDQQLEKISKDLIIEQEPSKYAMNRRPIEICLYDVDGNDLYVPFGYKKDFPRPERKDLPTIDVECVAQLREKQKVVRKEAIDYLNQTGSVIIASHVGFGKTCIAINIATKLKLKTLVVCNRIVLIKQWKEAIQRFCPKAKIQILTSTSNFEEDKEFYIINAVNIPKHSRQFYSKIGILIIDEAHLILAEKLSHCMRYIVPRYMIGLSATPYRHDGLNALFDLYFGVNKIVRKLFRKHIVYKVSTGFEPEVKLNAMGKIDWSYILESQCSNTERNELIIKILQFFPERTFLVLCKRVEQAKYLLKRLEEEKEDVTSLIGSNQTYEQSSRILVGTIQKTGTGFDHPELNAMILASDVEQYFIQYLGRVFRREDTEPIIFDLVDKLPLLVKHYRTREQVYTEHGGEIKHFFKEYPQFNK